MYYLYSFNNIICQKASKIVEYGFPTTMVVFETASNDLNFIVKREIFKEHTLVDIAVMQNYIIFLAKTKDYSVLNKVFVLCKNEDDVAVFEKDMLKMILNQKKAHYYSKEILKSFLTNFETQKKKRQLSTKHN